MYDELVKTLRVCEEGQHCDLCLKWHDKQSGGMNVCQTALLKEAADAIEKLEKQLHAEKEVCDGYYYAYQHWMHQYIKDIGDRDAGVIKTCVDCQRDCQMIGLDMPACTAYEPPKEET